MIRKLLSPLFNRTAPSPRSPLFPVGEGPGRPVEGTAPPCAASTFDRPSFSYPAPPRRSAGKIGETSPRAAPRNPLVETALRPFFGMPVEIVEPGTVVRTSRTGEECTVDDNHAAISDCRIFMTRLTYERFEADRRKFGPAVPA